MLDCRIRGGLLVDGTGSPARREDVAIRERRFVVDDGTEAGRTIDAGGLVVSPGFIDLHTHYDAQVYWDPALSPSPQHGVTTVVAGNCGFTLAPMTPENTDYISRMLARVEGMPYEALAASIPWDWHTHSELFAGLERRGVGLNIGVMAGHSTLRRHVMGERAVGERATTDDVTAMAHLLDAALRGGALGLSTSQASTQPDGAGQPVPSRWAESDEIVTLAGVVRNHPGTMLQYAPPGDRFDEATVDLMIEMSLAGDRPVNWNLLIIGRYDAGYCDHQLAATTVGLERGAVVRGLVRPDPTIFRVSFTNAIQMTAFKQWRELELPLPERLVAFTDPETRRSLRARAEESVDGRVSAELYVRWDDYLVGEVYSAANEGLSGHRVGDIAASRGESSFDVLLNIAVADEFRTGFYPRADDGGEVGWQARARLCADPRLLVGGSDAGGHLDMMCGPVYSTVLLSEFPRRGLLPLEECVRLLTTVPAQYIGLHDRGRIAPGYRADAVIFDPTTVGTGPFEFRTDLPAGGGRVYAGGTGIQRVLVNGVDLVFDGEWTGARPGAMLRSGRDTQTFDNAAGRAALGSRREASGDLE